MKTSLAILALSLITPASSALAATTAAAEAGRYFATDAGLSFAAVVLAAGMMAAVQVSSQRRREAIAVASVPADWRNRVMRNLDADLQRFSHQLRRAA